MAQLARRRPEGAASGMLERFDPLRALRDFTRWDPFAELDSFFPRTAATEAAFMPDVEVRETKDAYIIKADLPGMNEKEVDISIMGNRLTISGKREEERKTEDERCYAYERSYGSFSRSFTLPESADADQTTAELKDGVLALNVPKRAGSQHRRIAIGGQKGEAQSTVDVKGEARPEGKAEAKPEGKAEAKPEAKQSKAA